MKICSDYLERCYAGWLGKIVGVRLGAPIEGWSYQKIRNVLGGNVYDYIVDYNEFAADDDTNGPMFFLRAMEDYTCSEDLTAEQIGKTWLNYTPYEHGFYWWGGYGASTEHTAYLNLRAGIPAPQSGSIAQNGTTVAEQIGGQIFIDTWGLVNPGNPERAARFARKAASVSHDGEGIYGGIFVAACIAESFVNRNIRAVLEKGLSLIPADCEYVRMAKDVFAFYDPKALLKAKNRLRAITKRNRGVNVRKVMKELQVYMTGWLNYYGIASLKAKMQEWDERLRHRIRAYIWKQWKKPKTKLRNLIKLKVPEYFARMAAYSRRGYWFTVNTGAVKRGITNEKLIRAGFFELSPAYESIQSACTGRAVYRTVRMVR